MLRAFIDFVVHRRLVALCATLAIAIYGIYAYLQTAIEAYPDVTNVQVGIIAGPWPGSGRGGAPDHPAAGA
jgi:cobalt-zinc-cadmium resistance protein CzcA